MASFSRTRPVAPLSRQQVLLLLPHGVEDGGDDSIVPSTPTLYVPRRSDGFAEAVSSPVVPTSGRFSFNESGAPSGGPGSNEVVPEQTLEIANVDDNGEWAKKPTKKCLQYKFYVQVLDAVCQLPRYEPHPRKRDLQKKPRIINSLKVWVFSFVQVGGGKRSVNFLLEIPAVAVGEEAEAAPEGSSGECMGPPSVAAGTSSETTQTLEQSDDMVEGEDGVSFWK